MSSNLSLNNPGSDQDRNGFVDGAKFYTLATDDGGLLLQESGGRRYSDRSSPRWNALQAVPNRRGFDVLLQGEGSKQGQFRMLAANSAGRINSKSAWTSLDDALASGWEDIFGDVIRVDGVQGPIVDLDGNGFVDDRKDYLITADDAVVPLRSRSGKFLSSVSSKRWDAIKAIGVKDGFQVLLQGQRKKGERFRQLDVNLDGSITRRSKWMKGSKALFAGWDARFRGLLLADSSGSGALEAASVEERDAAASQLIYSAVATDASALTYGLEASGDAPLTGLTIDASTGEVRLSAEMARQLPQSVSFLVTATDAAGNRSELPVDVSLTWDVISDPDPDPNGEAGISALSVEESFSSDDAPTGEADPAGDVIGLGSVLEEQDSITDNPLVAEDESVMGTDAPVDEQGESSTAPLESDGPDADAADSELPSSELTDSDPTDLVVPDPDASDSGDPGSGDSFSDGSEPQGSAEPATVERLSAPFLIGEGENGLSDSEGLINTRTPQLSGEAGANARLELLVDGAVLAETQTDGDGIWSFSVPEVSAFTDGAYRISVRELDADGSVLSISEELSLVVDGSAPQFTSASTATAALSLTAESLVETSRTYVVSNSGDDAAPGTEAQPFKTIQKAIDVVRPGDVVAIRGGTYRERLRFQDVHGAIDAPITFKSFDDEDVVITGAEAINTPWIKHDGNIWKTNLNFDVSQLYLDGQMLTAARWPNITKEWDRLDDSDRRNATPDSYWDIDGTRALALVDSEVPNVYTNHESQQRLSDLGFSVDGAMLVPHKSFGLTHSGEIINHKAGESSFDVDPNFELWLRSPGQKALKNFNWTSGNNGSVETGDLWPPKNGPVQGTKQFHYHLEGHLGFLDRPQEWHYDKESGDLFVWLPDEQDPNLSDLQARSWDRSTSYIADPDQSPDADYHLLLEIKDSSFLDFKGITLHTGIFELNQATNLNFDQMRFLYPTYDGRMLKDGQRPLYDNRIQPVSLKGRPELEQVPDSNISFSNSEFANGISGFLRAAGPGLALKNSYLHNVRDRGALRVAAAPRMNVERNTFHTFGFGGGGKIGDSSVWRYNHIYAFHGDGDISGIQVPAASQEGALVAYNWIHDAPGRNGIRFDGSPAGIRGTAHHNVAHQTRRGMRIKGDQHEIMNNTLFSNFSYDISASRGKFYGYLDSTPGCLEWECRYKPSVHGKDKNRRLGHFNSSIHNNAFDRMPDPFGVRSPNQAIGNSYVSDHGQDNSRTTLIKEELRDPENFDFRPKQNSPLVNAGLHIPGVTDGYQGEAPDSGAYEFGADSYWIPGHRTTKARTPIAPNGSTTVKPDADLMWLEGQDVALNHVYFGEDSSNLTLVSSQANNIYTPPEDLIPSRTYYWRIDTETSSGSIIEGDLWSFQVAEALPVIPSVLVRALPGVDAPIDAVSGDPLPDYDFYIGTYEVTNEQYAQFLNSVASVDDYQLYNEKMADTDLSKGLGGIVRNGVSGDYAYSVVPELANHPVTYVSFWDAARYVNWLSTGSTEDGVYTMKPRQGDNKFEVIERNQQSFDQGDYALPSHAEWVKAALYRDGSDSGLYRFPNQDELLPPDQANILGSTFDGLSPVGLYNKPSPYGTFDQAGNAWEWLDDVGTFSSGMPGRYRKGGSFMQPATQRSMGALSPLTPKAPAEQSFDWGFRVVQKRTTNLPPTWKSTSWVLDPAYASEAYSASIVDLAFDGDGDPLSFSIEQGPSWLRLTSEGLLEGNPSDADLGSHSLVLRVEDSHGAGETLATAYTIKVIPDTNAPAAPSVPQMSTASDSGISSTDQITNVATPEFRGTAEPGSTVELYLDGSPLASQVVDDSGDWVVTVSDPISNGSNYQLTADSIDSAGNRSPLSEPLTFTLDTLSPQFISPKESTALDENSGDNQIVYTALSDDASPVVYDIDDSIHFLINPETGVVRFLSNPDFEDQDTPDSFSITATDAAGNSSTRKVRFKVNDLDDEAPVFVSRGKAPRLVEHSGAGQIVYQAEATDGLAVTYGLDSSADDDSSRFSIDSVSGAVSLLDDPDYELQQRYLFTVSAVDALGNTASRRVQLGIKNIDESSLGDAPIGALVPDLPKPTGHDVLVKSRQNYNSSNADLITDFDVSDDRLKIQVEGFDLQSAPDFDVAISKKRFNQLRRSDVDFIYRANKNQSKPGVLYFNQNGPGRGLGGDGGVLAIFESSPALTADLVEFV